jgi:hypothetical protein
VGKYDPLIRAHVALKVENAIARPDGLGTGNAHRGGIVSCDNVDDRSQLPSHRYSISTTNVNGSLDSPVVHFRCDLVVSMSVDRAVRHSLLENNYPPPLAPSQQPGKPPPWENHSLHLLSQGIGSSTQNAHVVSWLPDTFVRDLQFVHLRESLSLEVPNASLQVRHGSKVPLLQIRSRVRRMPIRWTVRNPRLRVIMLLRNRMGGILR